MKEIEVEIVGDIFSQQKEQHLRKRKQGKDANCDRKQEDKITVLSSLPARTNPTHEQKDISAT